MDFQNLVDMFSAPCAVISTEKDETGNYRNIRVHAVNEPYKKLEETEADGRAFSYELFPKDGEFEDAVYESCFNKKHNRFYTEANEKGYWIDRQLMPLNSSEDEKGYCLYFFDVTKEAKVDRMSSVKIDTAETIIRSILTLMSTEDFKQNVWFVLEDFRRSAEAMSCRIILLEDDEKNAELFCGAYDPDSVVPAGIPPYEVIRTWKEAIGESDCLIIQNEYDFEVLNDIDHIWCESLKEKNVKSLIITPLVRFGNVVGYMYVTNYNTEKTADLRELIDMMSFILGSQIANNQLVAKLAVISGTDGLTGLNNRYKLKQRLESIVSEKICPYGIVNMDINGLKFVNDSKGHDMGDEYILACVELMESVFDHEDLYRIGGDEFLAIITSRTKEEFDQLLKKIKEYSRKDETLSLAIGSFWSEETTATRDAMKKADEDMYENKKEYYNAHPEFDRRKQ